MVKWTDSLLPTFRSSAPKSPHIKKKQILETKNNVTRTTKIPNSWLIIFIIHNIKHTSQGQLHIANQLIYSDPHQHKAKKKDPNYHIVVESKQEKRFKLKHLECMHEAFFYFPCVTDRQMWAGDLFILPNSALESLWKF